MNSRAANLAESWAGTPSGKPLHGEQQLMLLRFDAEFFRGRFAEMQELPDLPAKLGQIPVLIRS